MLFSCNDTYVGGSLAVYGEYSPAEAAILQKCIKPGSIIIEVGANIGALTVPMAQATTLKGLVYAFEPQRTTYYGLCGNVFLNGLKNVFCFHRAIGDVPQITTIPDLDYDFPGNFGAFSLVEDSGVEKVTKNRIPMEVNTLDQFGIPACDLLKVDVEGMELQVLRGAKNLIQTHKPIMYVENDREEKRDELMAYITELGYNMHQHFPALFSENNYRNCTENIYGPCVSGNLLAIHKDSERTYEEFAEFGLVPGDVKITIKH